MTVTRLFTINSRKFDGRIQRTWKCRLAELDDERVVFRGVFENEVQHGDLGLISQGTISWEYFWLDRWYSIFRFLEPDGRLRNFYCNVNMPPTLDGDTLDFVDLDIDIVVWPDRSYAVLDVEEFEANSHLLDYPAEVRQNAARAVDEIIGLIESEGLPAG